MQTPLIREQLSLNASWFSYARTQRNAIFWKNWFGKKNVKNFIVHNNDKIICSWYLSSKWPVCRSIVNQTNGGASRTKWSTLFKKNIYKYWVRFCNKVAKMHLQQRNSLHSNNGHFCPFRNYFPFNWKAKLVIYYFFIIILSHQAVALCWLRSCNLLFIFRLY